MSDTPTADEGSQPYGMAAIGVLARAVEPHTPQLPTGTVTFLLTDVEDNVRLFDTYPQAMRIALARHDALIEAIVVRHAGTIVRPRGEGDSRFGVFTRPTDAVAAAVEIQLALAREPLGLPEPLRLHLALHTGEADVRDGDYYGSPINRCARLRALAHGGQGLLSGSTFDLVQDAPDRWPAGCAARFLGEFRLRGLARPERIYQLVIDGLQSDFPPLASAEIPPHNLPGQLTSFVGRERELAALERRLLEVNVRLVTLTGPGGVGKTRLALQVAGNVLGEFKDGVYFVSLAGTQEPELVPSAIAQALGILDNSARPLLETLTTHLRAKRLLLVLDNFEQVHEAAPIVAELLRGCRLAKALVTSRSILHLSGEHTIDVAPLGVPAADEKLSELDRYDAVRLFVDRARAAQSEFAVTAANASILAEICRRVDGLPLAIELVAARIRGFSLSTLNSHLVRHRLALLADGPRDAPARHRALRATIAWSYGLLTEPEQALLRRLAVFAGGCTPAAAQRVCQLDGDPLDVQAALQALVDKSLLRLAGAQADQPRYLMLETIGEYALELLSRTDEEQLVRRRHAQVFQVLLEEARRHLGTREEGFWLRQLEAEVDNLRAAMRWAHDQDEIEIGLQIADAAWPFWTEYGYTQEGVRWLNDLLRRSSPQADPLRARVAAGAGWLNHQLGDLAAAQQFFTEALVEGQAINDLRLVARALGGLSFVVHEQGDFESAARLAAANVTVAEELGDASQIARGLTRRAEILVLNGDAVRGAEAAERAIAAAEAADDTGCVAAALDALGLARRMSGSPHEAAALLERAVRLHEELGYKANSAEALLRWADALLLCGEIDQAAAHCLEALKFAHDASNQRRIATSLRVAASVAVARADFERGLRLAWLAQGLYARLDHRLTSVEQADLNAVLAAAELGSGRARPTAVQSHPQFTAIDSVVTELLTSGI